MSLATVEKIERPEIRRWRTVAELLHELGDIPPERVCMTPYPGTATLKDLITHNERKSGPICEWIEGTLVEKSVGYFEGKLAYLIGIEIGIYLKLLPIGEIVGEASVMKILPGIGRAPDVSFVAWSSLPGGKPSTHKTAPVPAIVPDLAIEVWSKGNTRKEMKRKRGEYFQAGVKLVWEIFPKTRTAVVYTSPTAATEIPSDGILDGGAVLPNFQLSLKQLFDWAEPQ